MADTRILVAIDELPSSRRAINYIANLVGRRRRFQIYMAYVLPPLPPALLEHGGSENPKKEAQLEKRLKQEQRVWIRSAKKAAQRMLNEARLRLRSTGISVRAIHISFSEPVEGRCAADDILQAARRCRCRTVVVGRSSLSWFHELLSQDLPEGLLRRAKGFSVWFVQ